MMSSAEVSQLMMSQNAMFSGQMQFAERIGPGGGLHAYGGGRPVNPYEGVPGVGPTPFSYSATGGMGYGMGNKGSAMAMSGLGAAASVGGMAMGFAGMLPRIGGVIAPLVDPFSAFGAARGAATALGIGGGMGVAAGLAGAAVPIGIGMLGASAAHSFVQGGQQQSLINTTLGQNFGFTNLSSRSGGGFNREDSMQIGSQIRQLAHVPEMMTSVQELTALIPKLKASGAMVGVRDAGEFNRRFKEAVTTIREVSKIIGSTMEEAAEMFAHSRRVGFLGKTDQLNNTLNVQLTSSVTGMSNGQVMGMQTAGANLGTAFGTSRKRGAMAVTNAAQMVGGAVEEGRLDLSQIEDVTGVEGEGATGAFAERITGKMMQMAKGTAAGRYISAGLARFDETGRYIGMDQSLAKRMREGTLSMGEIKSRGLKNMSLRRNQAGFTARANDIAGDFAGSVGAGGLARFAENIGSERYPGLGSEGATVIGQQFGLDANEMDIARQMGGDPADEIRRKLQEVDRASTQAYRSEHTPGAAWRRVKTKAGATMFGGIQEAGAKFSKSVSQAIEDTVDDFMGTHITSMSKHGAEVLSKAFGGDTSANKELTASLQAAMSTQTLASEVGRSGGLGGIASKMLSSAGPLGMGLGMVFGGKLERGVNEAFSRFEFGGIDGTRSEYGQHMFMKEATGAVDDNQLSKYAQVLDSGKVNFSGQADQMIEKVGSSMREIATSGDMRTARGREEVYAKQQASTQKYIDAVEHADGYKSLRLYREKLKNMGGGGDLAAGFMAAAGKGKFFGVSAKEGFGATDSSYLTEQGRAKILDEAQRNLGINASTTSILQGDERLSGILKDAIVGGNSALGAALDMPDDDKMSSELVRLGHDVSPKEAKKMREAYNDMKIAKDKNKNFGGELKKFEDARMGAEWSIAKKKMERAGLSLYDSIKNMKGLPANVKAEIDSLSEAMRTMKPGDKGEMKDFKDKLAKASGLVHSDKGISEDARYALLGGEVFGSTEGIESRFSDIKKSGRGFKSSADLATALGLKGKDITGILSDNGIAFSAGEKDQHFKPELMEALKKNMLAEGFASRVIGEGASTAPVNERLVTSLNGIDNTMKDVQRSLNLNTSALLVGNNTPEGKSIRNRAEGGEDTPLPGTPGYGVKKD